MPHHYKKKQTGPIDRTKKQGPPPRGSKKPAQTPNVEQKAKKPFPDPPTKTKKSGHVGPDGTPLEDWMARDAAKRQERQPINLPQKSKKPGMIYPERKKSGFFMQMGSKEINTPSNFSKRSAMLMNGDPGSGHYNMYGDYYKDAMNSLGQDQMMSMEETFDQAYEKAGYGMPELTKAVQSQSTQEGYSALGEGLGKILFPNAKENKEIRKEEKEKGLYTAGSSPKKGGYFSQDRVRKRVQNRVARKSARKTGKKFKI